MIIYTLTMIMCGLFNLNPHIYPTDPGVYVAVDIVIFGVAVLVFGMTDWYLNVVWHGKHFKYF